MGTPALEQQTPPGEQRWYAGTLRYTRGGLVVLFFWLLWGDFSLALRDRSIGPTFQLLLKRLGASDFLLAMLVSFIPHAISLVLGPVISYRSDRHRGRWGRRIPFLLIPTPLCFLGMVGLAFSPKIGEWAHPTLASLWEGATQVIRALPEWAPYVHRLDHSVMTLSGAILFTVAVCWTMFEICAIAAGSVFGGLIADVVPRPVMGRFYGLFRTISLLDGIFFMLVLIRYAEQYYVWIFCGVGLLYAVAFTQMCLKVKEGDYPPPPAPVERPGWFREIGGAVRRMVRALGRPREMAPAATGLGWYLLPPVVRLYLTDCFAHSYYRWLVGSIALSMMAFVPINTFSIYYFKTFNMEMKVYGWYSAAQFMLSLAQAYIIGWLADRFHPIRLILISFFLHGTTVVLAFFLVRGPTSFGIFHILTGSCAGFFITAYGPYLPAMLPRARYATFTSAITLSVSIGTMVVAPACGWFLDQYVNHQYRYIFVWALVFDVAALLVTLRVYRRFMEYGGPKGYVAPEA